LVDAGRSVTVTESAGTLSITSDRYGSDSIVKVTGGTAATTLLGASPTETTGNNVAGSLGGVLGSGVGRVLAAQSPSKAQGLAVEVLGGTTGDRGSVRYALGVAEKLDRFLDHLLASEGVVEGRTEGLEASIKDLERQRDVVGRRLELTEQRLRAEFAALDSLLSSMLQTSSYLSTQLRNLPKVEGT
jgi:flagellar hook-associated protein 2